MVVAVSLAARIVPGGKAGGFSLCFSESASNSADQKFANAGDQQLMSPPSVSLRCASPPARLSTSTVARS